MKTNLASTLAAMTAMTASLICLGASAGTPNTSAAGAVSYEVGEGWVSSYVDETAQSRWFAYKEVPGRSYCVDAAMGSATSVPLDPNLTIYTDVTGATVLSSNTDSAIEPPRNKGATICYVSPLTIGSASQIRTFKVNVPIVATSGDSGLVRTQVLESTLYGESFVHSTDASALTVNFTNVYLYNHSNSTINASLYLPAFGLMGPYSIPAESGKKISPRPSTAANYNYSNPAFVVHDGYTGALSGVFENKGPGTTATYYLIQR